MANKTVEIKNAITGKLVEHTTIAYITLSGDFSGFQSRPEAIKVVCEGGECGALFVHLVGILVNAKNLLFEVDCNEGHQQIFDCIMLSEHVTSEGALNWQFHNAARMAATYDNAIIAKKIVDATKCNFNEFFTLKDADDFANNGLIESVKMIYDNIITLTIRDDCDYTLFAYANAQRQSQFKDFVAYMVKKCIIKKDEMKTIYDQFNITP
jgi:hypothetical protein